MGLFDLFSRRVRCPACGEAGAYQSLFGGVRCPNRACGHFDSALAASAEAASGAEPGRTYRNPRTGDKIIKPTPAENFDPGAGAIEVRYKNFRGEDKTFVGDRRTLRRRGNHYSLRVAPSGQRLALARDRIGNLAEIEQAAAKVPNPREQHVLSFHRQRGTTSALFERLRARFPEW
jgi:hypothetical protein